MTSRQTSSILIVACLLGMVTWPGEAAAKADKVVRYAYEQVWPAAVRFLRLDEGLEVVEKDAEAGYVIFELSEEGKRFRGALELVRIRDDNGQPALRLIVRIEDRPSYMELGILERLERKLRSELGPPPEPRPAGPAKSKGEAS
jgi:hypothetical protein